MLYIFKTLTKKEFFIKVIKSRIYYVMVKLN